MKATALATCAVATFGLVAIANTAQAQSNEEILRRLEAKIDSLSKENASLRDRVQTNSKAPPALLRLRVTSLDDTSDCAGTSAQQRSARARSLRGKFAGESRSGYARPGCAQFGGWYVGGNVGWGVYDTAFSDRNGLKDTMDSGLPDNVDGRKHGVVGGAQGGYNWQSGCSLLGIETDWSWSGLKTSEFLTDGDAGTQRYLERRKQAALVRHDARAGRCRGRQPSALRDRRSGLRELQTQLHVFPGRPGARERVLVGQHEARLDRGRRRRMGVRRTTGRSRASFSTCRSSKIA